MGRLRGRSRACAAIMDGLTGCSGDLIPETPCKFRNCSACSGKLRKILTWHVFSIGEEKSRFHREKKDAFPLLVPLKQLNRPLFLLLLLLSSTLLVKFGLVLTNFYFLEIRNSYKF